MQDRISYNLRTRFIELCNCVLDKIQEYRRNLLLHLQRMPQKRIPFKSYHYTPHRRTIARPKKRWRDQL